MESTYLKYRLLRLVKEATESVALVNSESFRFRIPYEGTGARPSHYPAASGVLEVQLATTGREIAALVNNTLPRLEAIEREHERLVSIFEALDIDLDEDALAALELIGKRTWKKGRDASPYLDERRQIIHAFSKAIANVQESERENEHENAADALIAAGFVYDEENECFARGDERVTVTLTNGRECRYEWQHQRDVNGDFTGDDSGKSGEFHRLLSLIASEVKETSVESAQ